ncbi:MAG: hypothetical protein GXO73_07165, partial [Calditrichaeota bacterium]|nr:hypothetical protein [Calditrichota bacterium]
FELTDSCLADDCSALPIGSLRVENTAPTGVSGSRKQAPVPEQLRLEIRPNPSHGRAELTFRLTRRARVSVSIYDVRGRRVATLVDGVLTAGAHRVSWRGWDQAGAPLPSGVYLASLRVGPARTVSRLVLLR